MNAGCRALAVFDAVQGAKIPAWLFYPSESEARVERFGQYAIDVAMDGAPAAGGEWPLVLVSHGRGSTPWVHRDLGVHLARERFAVAMLAHAGNTLGDDGLMGTSLNLENRPRHVRLVADAALADEVIGPRLLRRGFGIVGHSFGGYTALVAAGGRPTAFPDETLERVARPLSIPRDPRVRALVLLAPATEWLAAEGALAEVDVPILMRTGEKDAICGPHHAEIVLRGVRDRSRVDHAVVPNAGHFSFLTPFPPERVRPDFPPSQDPPGFDRVRYREGMKREIAAFLRRTV